jgi:hypothetical protein
MIKHITGRLNWVWPIRWSSTSHRFSISVGHGHRGGPSITRMYIGSYLLHLAITLTFVVISIIWDLAISSKARAEFVCFTPRRPTSAMFRPSYSLCRRKAVCLQVKYMHTSTRFEAWRVQVRRVVMTTKSGSYSSQLGPTWFRHQDDFSVYKW